MRIAIITRDEPFFVPIYLSEIVSRRSAEISAVFLADDPSPHLSIRKLLRLCGPLGFALSSLRYAAFRILGRTALRRGGGYFYSVGRLAKAYGVQTVRGAGVRDPGFRQRLEKDKVDVLLSVGNSQIIPDEILRMPGLRCLNTHGSLLPAYKGVLTAFWMLLNDEKEGGVSIHFMTGEIDGGAVVGRTKYEIGGDDTVFSIYGKIAENGKDLIARTLDELEAGTVRELEPSGTLDLGYFSAPGDGEISEFIRKGKRFC